MEEIWREYHAALWAFIRRRVGDEATADDILQEVFLKMHGGLASLKDETKLKGWLYRTARNAILDHFRAVKPVMEVPDWLAQPETEPAETARQELARCLQPMIRQLPEKYREAIELSELQGLAQREVAELQSLSLSGAKSRIQRGRALLKEMLAECCRLEFDHGGRLSDYQRRKKSCDSC